MIRSLSSSFVCVVAAAWFLPNVSMAQTDDLTKTLLHSVVKISSRLKNGDAEINGSGLLYTLNGKAFVVTSDHVIFHSNTEATHTITFQDGHNSAVCLFVRASYEYGVASLACPNLSDANLFEFHPDAQVQLGPLTMATPNYETDPNYLKSQDTYGLMVAGYPFSTAQIVVDQAKGTSSLVYKAFNPLIMGVDVMHEVNNVHAEPGMSGGILFANNSPDSTGPLILGMISHRRKAGDGNITAYAIPAQIVVGFMREVIEDPSRRSRIRQEVRNQLRGPFDVSIGTYNFEYLDEGNVQAFRLRKIGHFPDSPQPPQEKYFEPMLDYYLPQHPLCVPYLVASWGTRYLGNFNFDFRLKPVTNPIEILDNQDRDEEEPLFLMRCPQTAQSLTKLASVRDQLEQFFSVVPVDLNRITRRLKEFHDELMQNLSDSQDQQIPRYVISFKAHEARDFLKGYAASRAQIAQQGQGPRLEQILNDAAQALEFINL